MKLTINILLNNILTKDKIKYQIQILDKNLYRIHNLKIILLLPCTCISVENVRTTFALPLDTCLLKIALLGLKCDMSACLLKLFLIKS